MSRILLDPITRIEGHLKVEALLDNGVVKEAKSTGTLFRGIELILQGRDPRDAQAITQRICGVCPTSHSIAATLNLDSAFGIADKIPDNGRILRNLILGAAHLSDHILHFYHLAALDFVDVTKVAAYEGKDSALNSIKSFIERGELGPFVPRYEGDYRFSAGVDQELVGHYVQALTVRRKGQEMLAIFGGKIPHNATVVPGGVTETPTVDKITSFLWRLNGIKDFIDNVYIPDVLTVAKTYSDYFETGIGCGNLLSFGNYDLDGANPDYLARNRFLKSGAVSSDLKLQPVDPTKIAEYVANSWYEDSTTGLKPTEGQTVPTENWAKGYSWVKAPRIRRQGLRGRAPRQSAGQLHFRPACSQGGGGFRPICRRGPAEGIVFRSGTSPGACTLRKTAGRFHGRLAAPTQTGRAYVCPLRNPRRVHGNGPC